MSVENVKQFYEDITRDENSRKKLEDLKDEFNLSEEASDDELISTTVAIAGKLGYLFSVDEFKEHISSIELSDDILEDAAGGNLILKGMIKGTILGAGLGALLFGGGEAVAISGATGYVVGALIAANKKGKKQKFILETRN